MASNQISRRELLGRGLKIGAGAVGMVLLPYFNRICKGEDEIVYRPGKLMLYNEIADISGGYWPLNIVHRLGATEDYGTYDSPYNNGPPEKPNTKVVSILETKEGKKELETDSRPKTSEFFKASM